MLRFENREGRLVEIIWSSPTSVKEVSELMPAFAGLIHATAQRMRKVVIVADLRGMAVMSPDVAERLKQVMLNDDPALERSAYLLPTRFQETMRMQLDRLAKAATNPNRRSFSDVPSLLAWLDPVATEGERRRIAAFLAERD